MNCAPVFPLLSNNWTPDANRALKILMPGSVEKVCQSELVTTT